MGSDFLLRIFVSFFRADLHTWRYQKRLRKFAWIFRFFARRGENITEKYLKLKCFSLIFHESLFCFEVYTNFVRSSREHPSGLLTRHLIGNISGAHRDGIMWQHRHSSQRKKVCEAEIFVWLKLKPENYRQTNEELIRRKKFLNNFVTSKRPKDQVHDTKYFFIHKNCCGIASRSWKSEAPADIQSAIKYLNLINRVIMNATLQAGSRLTFS